MTPKELAIKDDYDDVKETGKEWNGYKIFIPIFNDNKERIIGLPYTILQNEKETRFTTVDECFKVLDVLYPNNSDE